MGGMYIRNAAAAVEKVIKELGNSVVRSNLELSYMALYSVINQLKALNFVKAKRRWRQLGVIMDQMLNRYDTVLTPTLGEPHVPVGSQQPGKKDRFTMKSISSFVGKLILSSRRLTYSILEEIIHNSRTSRFA